MAATRSTYRNLLTNVLPVDRLGEPVRRLVRDALDDGDVTVLWRTAGLALDDLCRQGLWTRTAESSGGSITYVSREELKSITLEAPRQPAQRYEFPFRPALPENLAAAGAEKLESLFTGVATHASGDELADSVRQVLECLQEIVEPDHTAVVVYTDEGERGLTNTTGTELARRLRPHFQANGDALYIPDVTIEPAVEPYLPMQGCRSIAVLPLRVGADTLGVLEVCDRAAGAFDEHALGLLSLLALLAAGRIRNARRLERLIYMDRLTGVFTRRYFEIQVVREVERANRDSTPLALVMVDLDNFKEINDTFGHPVGDRALAAVGGLLADHVRKIDVVTRYGGEEFALLLPGATLEQAETICERIRGLVEELTIRDDDGGNLNLTTSMGIAIHPDHVNGGNDANEIRRELLEKADRALLMAKKAGKNRVVVWPSS